MDNLQFNTNLSKNYCYNQSTNNEKYEKFSWQWKFKINLIEDSGKNIIYRYIIDEIVFIS